MVRFYFPIVFLAVCGIAQAQPTTPAKVPAIKLTVPPVIDGVLDDEAWKQAATVGQFVDVYGSSPVEDQTEVRIGYDDNAIYVAWNCKDTKPDQLVGREVRPGAIFDGEDYVVVRIDPFYTRQGGAFSRYMVNSIGTQSETILSGRAAKREWRGDWQGTAKRTPDGYVVEMRIPWTALDYPGNAGGKNFTINFVRFHARLKIRSIWSNTGPAERPEFEGTWTDVQPPKRNDKAQVQWLPYLIGEVKQNGGTKTILHPGFDVRYPITSQVTAVGSVNPDFKNVEQQVENISFSRSERFLTDARPFFAEGNNLFNLGSDFAIGRMFYSRRIRDFDIGTKVYGRPTDHMQMGALATYQEGGFWNGVANLSYELGTDRGGAVFGTSHREPGIENNLYGASGYWRMGNWWVTGEGERVTDHAGTGNAYTTELFYQVPKFFTTARYSYVDSKFNPSLGLIQFTDRRGGYAYSEFNDEYKNGFAKRVNASFYVGEFKHFDGKPFDKEVSGSYRVLTKNDQRFSVSGSLARFEGSRDQTVGIGYTYGATNRFKQFTANLRLGELSSDPYRLVTFSGSLRLLKKLDVGFQTELEKFQGTREQYITSAGWEFDAKRSLTGRVVRRGSDWNAYLAFRSSGFKGQELFVILGDPNASSFKTRLAVKFVFPFST